MANLGDDFVKRICQGVAGTYEVTGKKPTPGLSPPDDKVTLQYTLPPADTVACITLEDDGAGAGGKELQVSFMCADVDECAHAPATFLAATHQKTWGATTVNAPAASGPCPPFSTCTNTAGSYSLANNMKQNQTVIFP